MNTEKVTKTEKHLVHASAAVYITDSSGRLLLLKQAAEWKGKKWGPPAGGMLFSDNTPTRTAVRETKEETGLGVTLTALIGVYRSKKEGNYLGIGFVFTGELEAGDFQLNPEEISEAKYFTKQEIEELIAANLIYRPDFNLPAINDWKAGITYPIEVIK